MLPIAPEVFLAEKFNVLFRTMNEQLREPPPEQLALEMPPTPRWPGWHDDPNDPASLRYGDGGQRTEQGAPKTAAGGHRSHSFDDFDPRQYLSTYFSTVMEDERELMRWLVEHGRQHVAGIDGGQRVSMLDLGCGPTVHHILPIWDLLDAVTVMDLLPGNLDEISRWLHAPDNGHDWGPFAVECHEQLQQFSESSAMDGSTPDRILFEARSRLRVGGTVDLLAPSIRGDMMWDLVGLFFVACSVSERQSDFDAIVLNACDHVRPGGALLAAFLGGCDGYRVGDRWFPSARCDEEMVRVALSAAGLDVIQLNRISTPSLASEGFDHIFVLAASRVP